MKSESTGVKKKAVKKGKKSSKKKETAELGAKGEEANSLNLIKVEMEENPLNI